MPLFNNMNTGRVYDKNAHLPWEVAEDHAAYLDVTARSTVDNMVQAYRFGTDPAMKLEALRRTALVDAKLHDNIERQVLERHMREKGMTTKDFLQPWHKHYFVKYFQLEQEKEQQENGMDTEKEFSDIMCQIEELEKIHLDSNGQNKWNSMKDKYSSHVSWDFSEEDVSASSEDIHKKFNKLITRLNESEKQADSESSSVEETGKPDKHSSKTNEVETTKVETPKVELNLKMEDLPDLPEESDSEAPEALDEFESSDGMEVQRTMTTFLNEKRKVVENFERGNHSQTVTMLEPLQNHE